MAAADKGVRKSIADALQGAANRIRPDGERDASKDDNDLKAMLGFLESASSKARDLQKADQPVGGLAEEVLDVGVRVRDECWRKGLDQPAPPHATS